MTSTVPDYPPATEHRADVRSAAAAPPAIRLDAVTKSFGDVQAVRGIDLAVGHGEIVAFLGPNGAGKTTTIDMILGLTRPSTGSGAGAAPVPHETGARRL